MGKPQLVVLAAGMGSRYGGLKQIDPVGPHGETIMDYSIYDALRAGFGGVTFVIRREMTDVFHEAIGQRFENHLDVEYAFQDLEAIPKGISVPKERQKPWGTGHAVLAAADSVTTPFAVVNADDFYGQNSYQVLADFLMTSSQEALPAYGLVGFELRKTLSDHGTVSRGICRCDAENRLLSVTERTHIERLGEAAVDRPPEGDEVHLTGDEYASMNMWGFTPSIFAGLERLFIEFLESNKASLKAEFYLPAAVDQLVASGQATCHVLPTSSQWAGITYREDRQSLEQGLASWVEQGVYPSPLWS